MGVGSGSASMAYLSPDENAARQRAGTAAQKNAHALFVTSPCPRCGTASLEQRTALYEWEHKASSRKQIRFWALMIGFGLTLLSSAACVGIVATGDDDGAVGAGIFLGFVWFILGAGASGILYAILGPGRRPVMLPYVPQGVQFDPPDPAQVQGTYRAG
jgi:hypothetical protein